MTAIVYSGCHNSSDVSTDENNHVDHTAMLNTKNNLPITEFANWVADKTNDLVKNKTISDVNYQIAFLPKDYLVYTELKNEDFTPEKFDAARKNYTGMTYFKFRIEVKNAGVGGELLKYKISSPAQYNARINYMSFKMQNDIFIVQGNDTLYPGMYHFERIYEIAPFATVMLAFDDKKFKPENEFTVVYNDRLFNKGFIKYNYSPKQLIDLPNIPGV